MLNVNGKDVTVAEARKLLNVPDGVCFGCYLGDCAPETHDVPDDCEYLGGFVYTLDTVTS